MELSHGARISRVQFLFWLTLTPLYIFNSYCEMIDYFEFEYDKIMMVVTSILTTILVIVSLVCHFFADARAEYESPSGEAEPSRNESPILDASFPSMLVFSWFTGFAWQGFKRSLGFDDLYELPPFVQSSKVVPEIFVSYQAQ